MSTVHTSHLPTLKFRGTPNFGGTRQFRDKFPKSLPFWAPYNGGFHFKTRPKVVNRCDKPITV